MVFNWFERQAGSPGEPPSTPDSPEVEQQPPADPVQVKPEPDHSAPQDDVEQRLKSQKTKRWFGPVRPTHV
jgi:fused signal recognition particle receptor